MKNKLKKAPEGTAYVIRKEASGKFSIKDENGFTLCPELESLDKAKEAIYRAVENETWYFDEKGMEINQ